MEANIYSKMSKEELAAEGERLNAQYEELKGKKYSFNMTRGVPCGEQLDLSLPMLEIKDYLTEGGADCRSYGMLDGIPEAKRLFSSLLGVSPEETTVMGNSSLSAMYDMVANAMEFGTYEGAIPWSRQGKIKFLCPVPGYDRHFSICEKFGIEMINIKMTPEGPDMDAVEKYAADESVKGIWCVPKYANPDGTVYSGRTVERFARLRPAARDFRIFWDNAYCVHDLREGGAELKNLADACREAGNPDIFYIFVSSSKITFAGAGVAAVGTSKTNTASLLKHMFVQTIGHDKMNQLRHVKFLKNLDNIKKHMNGHRAILKPKFDAVTAGLEAGLGGTGLARWTNPAGGYFISLDVPKGCASRTVALAAGLGVALTPAGSTYPYKKDPDDANIRIAPTFPSAAELKTAIGALCLCVRMAARERFALS